MATPFAPAIIGPITPLSTQIYVDNVLPNSIVTVYDDLKGTSLIGTANTTQAGSIWVPLTKALATGKQITARQQYTGKPPNPKIVVTGTSGLSAPVPVLPVPDPLPAPTYSSGLSTCMDSLLMSTLVPGANLEISLAGTTLTPLFSGPITTPVQWFGLAAVPLPVGATLKAVQSASGVKSSPATPSGPIQAAPAKLAPPVMTPVPAACQTSFTLSDVTPGADVKLTLIATGAELVFTATAPTCSFGPTTPMQAGAWRAEQYFTRCGNVAAATSNFTVKTQAPEFPAVSYAPCADVTLLEVANLVGGEILTVTAHYDTSAGSTSALLGQQGVSGDETSVALPSGWYPADAVGPVSLWISVTLCDAALPFPGYTAVTVGQTGGPFAAPTIQSPLYACAGFVTVTGHIGSVVQIFSGPTATAVPCSPPVVVTSDPQTINLWFPLIAKQSIFATQQGCKAMSPSPYVTVLPTPDPLPAPDIYPPARPGATTVEVNRLLTGAQVTLLVNGAALPAQYATSSSITFSTGAPLPNQAKLEVLQSLCGEALASATSMVAIGQLNLHIDYEPSPVPLVRGKANSVIISANDTVTGAEIKGLPVTISLGFKGTTPTGPSSSGVTGTSFSYTPGAADKTAVALVIGGPAYQDALLDIPLVDPLSVSYKNVTVGSALVVGTGFSSTICQVMLTEHEPLGSTLTTGPFKGNIVTGIPVTLQCTGSVGQYYSVTVQAIIGSTPSGPIVSGPNLSCP